jgi:retinol-binding protein 3
MISKTNKMIILAVLTALLFAQAVYGQRPEDPAVDAAKKQAIVDEIATLLNKNYIFADVAKKIEDRLRARLAGGEYDKFARAGEFSEAVSKDILDVGHDKHMGFAYAPDRAAEMARMQSRKDDEVKAARARQLEAARRDNFGFRKVERLDGNVGYIDFRYFADATQAGATAVAAMNFLGYCDAVIVDLRQNGGGSPSQIQLICSYFFDEATHLNDLYYRAADTTENYWTLPYVPGNRMAGADLYILTSSRTFSGAEEFSYNMKNQKRATIIGETTGGGAHPTDAMIIQTDYVLRVPIARAINPVSKTNWEGTGVAPDIQVPAGEAFDRAYSMALEKLAAKATDPEKKAELDWVLAGQKAKMNPVQLDAKILKSFAGLYGERKVFFENGGLYYQRTGPKLKLTPLTATLFAVEGLDYFRVEFIVKDGMVVELVGVYDNGDRQPSPRTK